MRDISWIAGGGVAAASLFAAFVSIVFQASHQVIIIGSIENLVWLFWAAVGFLALQFITRFFVEYREERANTRKKKAIGTIGVLIGEGNKLRTDLQTSPPSEANFERSILYNSFKKWEARVSQCIAEYEPKLNGFSMTPLG